jgi:SulP family sulfate permease
LRGPPNTPAPSDDEYSDLTSEETSLLPKGHSEGDLQASYDAITQSNGDIEPQYEPRLLSKVNVIRAIPRPTEKGLSAVKNMFYWKAWNRRDIWQHGVVEPVGYLPAVLLGLLLNVLDGLSYGECSLGHLLAKRFDNY